MARSRNIKPGFFKNEDLAECSSWARLCFAGLWILADREGRLEDRPKRIKGELFPFDAFEVDPLLCELEEHGFILRYLVRGRRYIQILQFRRHQNPHFKEPPSGIPPPQNPGLLPHSTTPKPEASPPLNEPKAATDPPLNGGQTGLIPDSGFLIPDCSSLRSEATSDEVARRQAGDLPPLALVETAKTKGPPDCPHVAILALWAEVLPAMPQHEAEQWKGARADHLRARWRETAVSKRWPGVSDGLAYFRKLFGYVGQSRFLTGRVQSRDTSKPPFTVTLAWLVKPENWAKTIEGTYHQDAA